MLEDKAGVDHASEKDAGDVCVLHSYIYVIHECNNIALSLSLSLTHTHTQTHTHTHTHE